MSMKISFELSDRDLDFFRKALKQSREAVRDADGVRMERQIKAASGPCPR